MGRGQLVVVFSSLFGWFTFLQPKIIVCVSIFCMLWLGFPTTCQKLTLQSIGELNYDEKMENALSELVREMDWLCKVTVKKLALADKNEKLILIGWHCNMSFNWLMWYWLRLKRRER